MKTLSRILTICLCFAPLVNTGAWAVVATNAGNNLTAFNPSTANNNQWQNLTNGRQDLSPTAKADMDNCISVILRCAQPKCGSGCNDLSLAGPIVNACVQSNDTCKQYGDNLTNTVAAQLVSKNNAKVNAQQAQAAAQAAAEAQAAQAAQQQQMQQMQKQMQQMQQQMQQQSAQSAQQLQEALAQQAQASQAALNEMKAAATEAAKQTESGVSAYQEEAIARGVSTDVLERQKVTGQILTEIQNAEVSLKEAQTAMNDAFEYAKCDARGNNCGVPKRIKRFREKALNFIDPYDNVVDKIYDALMVAQTVGVDLSEIYMMLNDSCNSWGQYMCPPGRVEYTDTDAKGNKGAPVVCQTDDYKTEKERCATAFPKRSSAFDTLIGPLTEAQQEQRDQQLGYNSCMKSAEQMKKATCKACTLLKVLTDKESVYEGWVYAEDTSTENQTVVACASEALGNSRLFKRRAKRTSGAGIVDIEILSTWLSQAEPSSRPKDNDGWVMYCDAGDNTDVLKKAMLSKSVEGKGINVSLCVKELKQSGNEGKETDPDNCGYISRVFGICDTHAYNKGLKSNPTNQADRDSMNEIIQLKVTVISQQLYKQYEYLKATLRRLKTQLEKSVLTSNLEAAGAKSGGSSGSSSSSLLGGGSSADKQNGIYLPNAQNCSLVSDPYVAYSCLQQNANLIAQEYKNKNACKQLIETIRTASYIFGEEGKKKLVVCNGVVGTIKTEGGNTNITLDDKCSGTKDQIKSCAVAINWAVNADKEERENKKSGANVLKGLLGG